MATAKATKRATPKAATRKVAPRKVATRKAAAPAAKAPLASRAARGMPSVAMTTKILDRVRAFCLALPHTTERISHGAPTWFIDDKRSFAVFTDDHHGDGRVALVCAAPDGMQAMLVEGTPEHYYLPPYVAHMGWVGIRLDRATPWTEIEAAIEQAFTHRAPKTILRGWRS